MKPPELDGKKTKRPNSQILASGSFEVELIVSYIAL